MHITCWQILRVVSVQWFRPSVRHCIYHRALSVAWSEFEWRFSSFLEWLIPWIWQLTVNCWGCCRIRRHLVCGGLSCLRIRLWYAYFVSIHEVIVRELGLSFTFASFFKLGHWRNCKLSFLILLILYLHVVRNVLHHIMVVVHNLPTHLFVLGHVRVKLHVR